MKFCFKALSSLCGEGLRSRSHPAPSRSVPKPSGARRVSPFTPESTPRRVPAQLPGPGSCRAGSAPCPGAGGESFIPASLGSVEDVAPGAPVPLSHESTVALRVLSGVREPRLAPLLAPAWWRWSGDPDCTPGRLCQEQPGLTGLVHRPCHAGEFQVLRPPRRLGRRDQVRARRSSLTHGGPRAVLVWEKAQPLVAVVSREPSSRGSCLGWL